MTAYDVDTAADELYATGPDEFVERRAALVKQARAAGDKEAAGRIQAMRKPTVAAWLVNQLSRRYRDDLSLLVDLGVELRGGMVGISAADMRELTKRRFQLVKVLVDRAGAIAAEAGRKVGNETAAAIRATLEATLAAQGSADQVLAGRLIEPIAVSGFGFGNPFAAAPPAEVVDLGAHRARRTKKVERAEEEVAAAERTARLAHERLDDIRSRIELALQQRDEAAAQVERLAHELRRAEQEHDRRVTAVDKLAAAQEDAEESAVEADDDVAQARRRLAELT